MALVPAGGYQGADKQVRADLDAFNLTFTGMVSALQSAWDGGSSQELQFAIDTMFALQPLATALFAHALPDGSGCYGPEFRFLAG